MEEGKERKREKRDQPTEIQQSLAIRGLFPLGITGRRKSMIGEVRGTNSHVCVAGASVRAFLLRRAARERKSDSFTQTRCGKLN